MEEGRKLISSPPIPPPANLQPAQGRLLCFLEEVYCVSICPPSPFYLSTSTTVWPEKTHGRWGSVGSKEAGAPAERRCGEEEGGFSLPRTPHCASVRWTRSHLCLWRDTGYV